MVGNGKAGNFVKLIKTEYDAYNRQFKLLDTANAGRLRDGETYLLMDLSDEELKVPPDHIEPETDLANSFHATSDPLNAIKSADAIASTAPTDVTPSFTVSTGLNSPSNWEDPKKAVAA